MPGITPGMTGFYSFYTNLSIALFFYVSLIFI